ncbi:MAG TPA: ABC transporter permease [Blastocatellia bacterium]|nr:ABC transporter permease [Blastocatellia bacterium]
MQTLWQDLRYGARMLLKNPGFTTIAVITLALGIGACTAIFSVVDAVLWRSLPFPQAERIFSVSEVDAKGGQRTFAEPNFLDLRARNKTLDGAAEYVAFLVTILGGSEPVRARGAYVSQDFFRVLGAKPEIGRGFLAEESKLGASPVAVVSYGYWQRLLGGRADLAASPLRIGDMSYTVVGVMPRGFNFPN